VNSRKRRQSSLPDKGPKGQAVVDRLLERVSEPEFCKHNHDDFGYGGAAGGERGRYGCERPDLLLVAHDEGRR
jgi:hypothetical protein